MFRTYIAVFFSLLTCLNKSVGQGFELTFGGPGTQICNGIVLGLDSSVYMLGFTSIGQLGGTDFMLSKISTTGSVQWTKYLGTPHDDFGVSILAKGQQLVLTGTTHDPVFNDQILVIVTDTSGIETSRYTYGNVGMENINSAKICPDGGYILSGSQALSGSNSAYVLKLDSTFNKQWDAAYGAGLNDYASEALMANSNTYYAAIDRKVNLGGGAFDYDVCILRTDSIGNMLWDSVYTDSHQNGSQGLFLDNMGNLIIYGETEIYPFSPFDYFIASVDNNGNLQWRTTFGGPGSNALFDVIEDAAGNFIGTGYGNSLSNGSNPLNLTIVKTDHLGNLMWQREYGFTGVDIGFRIISAPGDGYYVAGRASTVDDDDFYLIKTDSNGLTTLQDEFLPSTTKPNVFPNPFSNSLTVKSNSPLTHIKLFNMQSQLVFSYINEIEPQLLFDFSTSDLPVGIYIIELTGRNSIPYRNIIIKK